MSHSRRTSTRPGRDLCGLHGQHVEALHDPGVGHERLPATHEAMPTIAMIMPAFLVIDREPWDSEGLLHFTGMGVPKRLAVATRRPADEHPGLGPRASGLGALTRW